MTQLPYEVITIQEALIHRIEALKVELEAANDIINTLREERAACPEETSVERVLADALGDSLVVIADEELTHQEKLQVVESLVYAAFEDTGYELKDSN